MEPFKNAISPTLVGHIATQLELHLTPFERSGFEKAILATLADLELKQRVQLIADTLFEVLPGDVGERNQVLAKMLHPETTGEIAGISDETGLRGWAIYPLTMVVGQHGLDEFEGSLNLLKEMTKRFSAEFDVRYFLIADQERTLAIMAPWADDPDVHVRRLLSEGTRPRLPWGEQIKRLVADPSPMIEILYKLRDDPEEYVRRSVANHLNDISKDHPELIADLTTEWIVDARKNRQRLLRHACRGLIKQGHTKTLAAFGVKEPLLDVGDISIASETIDFGGEVDFSLVIKSTDVAPQSLVIDYVMHFQKANGKLAGKVFKWKNVTIKAGETLELRKSHAIRPITTRKYYGGQQAISVRINGKDFGYATFDLVMTDTD